MTVVVVACASFATSASAARYPTVVRSGFMKNCVATATVSLRARVSAGAPALASRYCACALARLEARLPIAAFEQYTLNLLAGRAQNPAHMKVLRDSMLVCARAALPRSA